MRALLCLGLLALAACPSAAQDDADLGVLDGGAFGGAPMCLTDDQCVAVAPTCCQCPTFAVPTGDPLASACNTVPCPMESCPANVRPACSNGRCELACVAMTCPGSCTIGFAMDAAGCLTCNCAPEVDGGCHADGDCAEVPADCCGCAHGGVDTAVLTTDVDGHSDMLNCPSDPQCPSVDVCEASATPQCLEGTCALSTGVIPANACGRSDLPACPTGQVCLVNANSDASLEGVGVCGTAP